MMNAAQQKTNRSLYHGLKAAGFLPTVGIDLRRYAMRDHLGVAVRRVADDDLVLLAIDRRGVVSIVQPDAVSAIERCPRYPNPGFYTAVAVIAKRATDEGTKP